MTAAGTAAAPPHLHITRDPRHGVTLYAQHLADALGEPPASPAAPIAEAGRVHLHFTDRLWGADAASAAAAIELLAERATVTVTLHDLPQPSDGARGLPRRAAAYRRVVAAAAAVVCNSRHEAALLARYVSPHVAPEVIPLPVDPAGADRRAAADRPDGRSPLRPPWPTVGVLGYIYPGKGHDRVLRALGERDLSPRPSVEALGRASAGHEHDLESLRRVARYSGVALTVSGYLDDDELLARCRRTDVPVIAHAHVSASGSLGSWLAAGRRPIVLRSTYMQEMAELHDGAITLVDPPALGEAIEHALAHPESTWLEEGARLGPTTAEVVERYRAFWSGVEW